jgi:hypothetical protein
MFAGSFRLVGALLLAAVILAGCGGAGASKQQWQTVNGRGFHFLAPAGWKVERTKASVSASADGELAEVSTFPLLKPYSSSLFTRVATELRTRMHQVAQQTGGRLTGAQTVTAGRIRSHSFDVSAGDHVDQYTFVLRGLREFQLLCRRKASNGGDVCRELITSFEPV